MSSKSGGYIELAKLNEEGIVIEEKKDFPKSIFSAVYVKAQLLLDDIVKENRKIRIKDKAKDIDIVTGTDTVLWLNNVISFEGRRGTGKTSAMLSFRKSLENYTNEGSLKDACYEERGAIRFSIIDYIDASKLERGEQLLALVLANMFQRLREKDRRDWEKGEDKNLHSDLYRLFDEVYGSVLSLKDMKQNYQDESPLRALTQLSNSQILQKKIRRLVKLYLQYMEKENYGYGGKIESYLVITIDDLDMYFQEKGESPFEMLETLHRYLMIPGVVILLTYNSTELQLGCEKHFAEIYYNKYDKLGTEEVSKQVNYIQELTMQYLKKVLPIHMRIHMVSWRKKDYGTDRQIKILLKKEEVEKFLPEFTDYLIEKKAGDRNEQSVLLTHKKFLFLLKASKTGIFYDACGEKRHYSEVKGLRELAQEFEFYKYLGNLQNENYKYKELLDGLYFRFEREHLLRGEQLTFDEYLAVPLYRRSKDILMDLRKSCVANTQKELSLIKYVGEAETSYSYGELLYGLYQASKNGWFRKQMVWCILDSYTIMLTKYYRKMIEAEKDDEKARKEKAHLMKIIGASVASSWSNLFLPEFVFRNNKEEPKKEKVTSEDKELENQGNGVQTAQKLEEAIEQLEDTDVQKRENETKETDYTSKGSVYSGDKLRVGAVKFSQTSGFMWNFQLPVLSEENELAEHLQQLEILNMFFSDIYHDSPETKIKESGFSIKYTANKLSDKAPENADKDPKLQMKCTDACFNIMNFVHNLFRGREFFENLHKKLKTQYEEYFSDLKRYLKEKQDIDVAWLEAKNVETFLEEHSLYKKYENWFRETHGLAMPVYSFDMMYNVFKRYYQNRTTSHQVPDEEAIWENVKEVYKGIGERLNEEDWFYYTNEENDAEDKKNQDAGGKFFKYYRESPFIDYIEQYGADKKFKDRFTEMLEGIRSLLVGSTK